MTWCQVCGWNIDPTPAKQSPKDAARTTRRRERAEQVFARLSSAPIERPGIDGARIGSVALALLCYVPTAAIFAAGLFVLLEKFPDASGFVFGIPLLLLGFAVAPRSPKPPRGAVAIPRRSAPALYALVDRAAASLHARPVAIIAIDRHFNASFGAVGFRRRRALTLGIPLWDALSEHERVALIGHELGHQINGDLAKGWLVGNALTTLQIWTYLLHPNVKRARGFGLLMLLAGRALMMPFEWLASAAYRAELSLLFRSTQRAEYLADRLGAQLGSTPAAVAMLDKLYLARPAEQTVWQARKWGKDPWEASRLFLTELPPTEWERLRRLAALTADSVDQTHPPTNLRIRLLEEAVPVVGSISFAPGESAAIDLELKAARASL